MKPHLIFRPTWLLATGLALTGCQEIDSGPVDRDGWAIDDYESPSPVATPDGPTDQTPTPVDKPAGLLDPSACALESSSTAGSYWIEPRFAAFTPNDGLFVAVNGYGGAATSMAVGVDDVYEGHSAAGLSGVDRDWTVGVFEEPYGVYELRALRDGAVVTSWDGYTVGTAVSPSGALAAAIVCDGDATRARLVDTMTGASRDVTVDADGGCYGYGPAMNRALFTDDDAFMVVTTITGELWSVDLATLETVGITAHDRPEEEFYYETIISHVGVRPGAHEVVTTGADGVMRRWSLPELDQIGDDVAVGAFRINENSYAPRYVVSPFAFTSDGATIAYTNVDGDVTITNASGAATLPSPTPPAELTEWDTTPSVPVAMAFSASGDRLGVGYTYGIGIWGCPGRELSRTSSLELTVPTQVVSDANGYATIPIEVGGASGLVAYRARIAGNDAQVGHFGPGTFMLWGSPGDELDVVVEAHDGAATARATVRVRFTQQP